MANNSTDYDYGIHTPLDSSGGDYSVHKSSFKNIRFVLPVSSTRIIKAQDIANLPGLAFELYGDVSMWRVLLAYNGLQDPIQDLVPGMVLKIPAKADVIAYLSSQKSNDAPTVTI